MPVTIPGNFTTTAVILSLDPTEQCNQFTEEERMFSIKCPRRVEGRGNEGEGMGEEGRERQRK